MAGRIGSIQRAQYGKSYGFVLYDETNKACVYLGSSRGFNIRFVYPTSRLVYEPTSNLK